MFFTHMHITLAAHHNFMFNCKPKAVVVVRFSSKLYSVTRMVLTL